MDKDDIPVRDIGPDRLGHSISSHSELGIPFTPDNRTR